MKIMQSVVVLLFLTGFIFGGSAQNGRAAGNENEISILGPKAEQGDADAQMSLGIMYRDGKGVDQNFEQAAAWFRKAAEQGSVAAQLETGKMFDKGLGVTRDLKEAVKSDETEKVKSEMEKLSKALHEVTTALYQKVAAEQAAQQQASQQQAQSDQSQDDSGDVVDADFKEVKDE